MTYAAAITSAPLLPSLNAPRLVLVTPPAEEPVTFAQVTTHMHVDSDEEQAYVEALITAARVMFEEFTGKTLVTTVWRAHWDVLPRAGTYLGACTSRELELPRTPLVSVASLKYLDEDGTEQTISTADYTVEPGLDPRRYSRLWLNAEASWPTLGSYPGALRCQFTAGYGAASAVPEDIKAALKFLVAHLFQNRVPVNVGNIVNELPFSLRAIIEMHQVRTIV